MTVCHLVVRHLTCFIITLVNLMREIRDKKINNKVLSKKDILYIWNVINQQYEYSKNLNNHSSLDLEFDCGGTMYQSESSELLQDGDIIDLKKVESICIKYYDYKLDRRIDVSLRNGNYGNRFIVKGEDRDWVAGIFNKIEIIFDAVKPQNHWFVRYNNIIFHITSVILGFFIISIISKFISPDPNPSTVRDFIHSSKLYFYIISLVVYWIAGAYPIAIFMDWVNKLWPSVEFDFGPEHTKLEKNRRITLGVFLTFIITSIIFPIITQFIN